MARANLVILGIVAVLFFATAANAAELPRRPVLGAAIAAIPDEVRAAQKVPVGQGVLIAGILPGLSAESAGLKSGDILVRLDGKATASPADVTAAVRAHKTGDTISAEIVRNAAHSTVQVALKGLLYETAGDFDISYEAVHVGNSIRRVIITKPRDGNRHPAVIMIGGIGCYSIDATTNSDDPYRQLLYALTRRGFVTMRIEKSGMGDSTGAPCAEVDMQTELDGYVAGLHMLKTKPFVDPSRAFIVGHSIGGIVGPLAAAKEKVRGIVAMETVGIMSWFDYELINTRRQLKLTGATSDQINAALADKEWCARRFLLERQPRAKVIAERAACADYMRYPASDAYIQQIANLDMPSLWKPLSEVDVAIIYGAADFVTGVEESKPIVDAINALRPGTATYIEIPDMDHYLLQMPNQAASFARVRAEPAPPAQFHPQLAKIVGDWLSSKAS